MTDGELGWGPAVLMDRSPSGHVRCGLCPYRCDLSEGRAGSCHVRRNSGGVGQTSTRNITVKHLDGVERKPFYHFRPGAKVLTIASPGCNFRCTYCINHRLSQYGRDDEVSWRGRPADIDALVDEAASEQGVLCLSYSEPGLAPELTLELAERARPRGVPLLWKTNGFLTPQAVGFVAPSLDGVNIDLKAADDSTHRQLTGAPLAPVLAAIRSFHEAGVWVEVSTPVAPGVDDLASLRTIARHLAGIGQIPWHLIRFSPAYRLTGAPPTSVEALARAVEIGHAEGLHYVYVERALGDEGRGTRCPECATTVIDRDVWSVRRVGLRDGRCPHCSSLVPGRWN